MIRTLPILLMLGCFLASAMGQSGCVVEPMSSIEMIAENCEHDVGTCSGDPCTSCSDSTKCCSPVYGDATVMCESTPVGIQVVRRCSCQPCGVEVVIISGSVAGECDSDAEDCDLAISFSGGNTRAAMDGTFSFTTELPEDGRVLFSVADDKYDKFYRQLKLVNTAPGLQFYNGVDVHMLRKSWPEMFDASQEAYFQKGANGDFSIGFLANSVTYPDGTPYTRNATIRINFFDPLVTDPAAIPLELVTGEDPPGFLSSSGMVQFELIDDAGNPLFANNVEFQLETNALDSDETANMGIWIVNEETGFWEKLSDMEISGTGRRRKRGNGVPQREFVFGTVNIRNSSQIWNLDALVFPYCHMKVRTFEDGIQVGYVQIISLYGRSINNAWTNYIVRYSSVQGLCVSVPCSGTNSTFDLVKVSDAGFKPDDPSVPDSVLSDLSFQMFADSFRIQIPSNVSVEGPNGPIYTSYSACYSAPLNDSFFILSSGDSGSGSGIMEGGSDGTDEGNGTAA